MTYHLWCTTCYAIFEEERYCTCPSGHPPCSECTRPFICPECDSEETEERTDSLYGDMKMIEEVLKTKTDRIN